jgi:hypothetical protein
VKGSSPCAMRTTAVVRAALDQIINELRVELVEAE